MHAVDAHRIATARAGKKYVDEYGIDHVSDPEYVIGNNRHDFWLSSYDTEMKSLILHSS